MSSSAALRRGIVWALPRGMFLLIFVGVLLAVGQALIIPAILICILSIMAPVILVAENKGAWRALMDALTLNYARRTPYSGWATFSCLLYICGLFYLVIVSSVTMNERLLALDVFAGAPRGIYLSYFYELPFGLPYWIVTITTAVLEQLAVATLPFISATLYLTVVGKRELGQA